VAASSESKPWIAPPLPHNEMLARTYSASNFGSITPLANQMTALNQSANSEMSRRTDHQKAQYAWDYRWRCPVDKRFRFRFWDRRR
jgi:hypothetical protein